ncbi:replicative helicase loader/inhibitor [Paenibacillus sp. LC231]|uniref:replicative helicase loader/inhibitor n=1 Tax=Paenibacillus sp. LC231 TaxID=1120679 RepID=UPI0009440A12|nr:replicative helicase loader/inhibitor [Paenibacillus sp. LC231]
MDRTGVILLMKYISGAYRSFRTVDDDQAEHEVAVWHDILQDIPNQLAMERTRELCRVNTTFPPTPAAIYQACTQQQERSVYDIQKIEREQEVLALKEYHENNVVGPPPDHVLEKLNKLFNKTRVPAFNDYSDGGEDDE